MAGCGSIDCPKVDFPRPLAEQVIIQVEKVEDGGYQQQKTGDDEEVDEIECEGRVGLQAMTDFGDGEHPDFEVGVAFHLCGKFLRLGYHLPGICMNIEFGINFHKRHLPLHFFRHCRKNLECIVVNQGIETKVGMRRRVFDYGRYDVRRQIIPYGGPNRLSNGIFRISKESDSHRFRQYHIIKHRQRLFGFPGDNCLGENLEKRVVGID